MRMSRLGFGAALAVIAMPLEPSFLVCRARPQGTVAARACGTASAAIARTDLRGVVQARGRSVENAVVWLEAPDTPTPAQTRKIVLDQRNLAFSPHVLVVRVGTVVEFPNNDTVFHNVFSFRDGKRFDLGMYPVGAVRTVTFNRPGLSRIFCNIHPHMAAYVWALDTPYFALSDETGAFTIPSVPVGTYTYHAWRPGRTMLTGSTVFDEEALLEIRWP
jgi:plastocyanin